MCYVWWWGNVREWFLEPAWRKADVCELSVDMGYEVGGVVTPYRV